MTLLPMMSICKLLTTCIMTKIKKRSKKVVQIEKKIQI